MSIKEFGLKLKKLREEKRLSQRGLGLSVGLSDKTISSYETGRSYPNLELLKRLGDVLGKPIDYFISSPTKDSLTQEYLEKIQSKQNELERDIKELLSLLKREE